LLARGLRGGVARKETLAHPPGKPAAGSLGWEVEQRPAQRCFPVAAGRSRRRRNGTGIIGTKQLPEGEDYLELNPTISISFLGHVLFPRVPEYHLRFHLLEAAHHFPLSADVEFHLLELPKFTKPPAELVGALDTWLTFCAMRRRWIQTRCRRRYSGR
jgi:PD-(D/E)XK nuclease-like transposase